MGPVNYPPHVLNKLSTVIKKFGDYENTLAMCLIVFAGTAKNSHIGKDRFLRTVTQIVEEVWSQIPVDIGGH